jgi:hypothetical protein
MVLESNGYGVGRPSGGTHPLCDLRPGPEGLFDVIQHKQIYDLSQDWS